MRLLGQFFFFFKGKSRNIKKCKTNENHLIKQKKVNKKQQSKILLLTKTFKKEKKCLFCVFYAAGFFLNNKTLS